MRTRRRAGISRLITAVFAAVLPALAFGAEAWAESKGGLSFQERAPEFDIGNATSLTVSPDGKHLYATGSQSDSISVFAVTGGGGDYDYVETETDGIDDATDPGPTVDGLRFADEAAVSPDGKQVYVVGGLDDAVAIFDRNAATGALSFDSAVTDTVGGDDLGRPEGVAVSPDGEFVYAVSNIDDSILAFDRDPADGSLTQVEMEMNGVDDATDAGPVVDGMESPTSVVVAPDGDAVYVGTDFDDSIAVFERDQATGKLVFVEFEKDGVGGVDGLNSVEDVIVSGDDDNVYATGGFDNAVAVFDRDTATEALSFVEVEKNNVDDPGDLGGTVSGLASPRQMGLSSDDRNLYIAGSSSDSIADFRRNATTGELNFVESESDGVDDPLDAGGTAAGLDGASALAVATDDANVYAGGTAESGLAVFARGGVLGQLSFGLARPALRLPVPRGVAVSPDGAHVVLATLSDQSLRSFSRDAGTGTGALVDTETFEVDDPSDTGGPPAAFEEPRSVAFSPDGKQVYVTDTSTYSVSAYAFNSLTGELSYLERVRRRRRSHRLRGHGRGTYEPGTSPYRPTARCPCAGQR
ncbi:MAG: beta-propeller fold lactonase family protein [Solirubrobacterales bacterium]